MMWRSRWPLVLLLAAACSREDRTNSGTPAGPAAGKVHQLAPADDPWGTQPAKPPGTPVVTDPLPHPFVWSAEKDGKTTTLLGTFHVGVDAEARIPLWVWSRFDAATALATEVDFHDRQLFAWTIRPKDAPSLHDELGPAYWETVQHMVGKPRASLLEMGSTAAAASQLSGYGSRVKDTAPMDGMLRLRAEGQHKQLVFLESAKAQSDLLGKVYSLQALETVIDNRNRLRGINEGFLRAYEDGQVDQFRELGASAFRLQTRNDEEFAQLMDTMLLARSRAWLPEIEKLHAAGGAFIAVGTLHLLGEGSVLDLLEKRGYKITRLTGP